MPYALLHNEQYPLILHTCGVFSLQDGCGADECGDAAGPGALVSQSVHSQCVCVAHEQEGAQALSGQLAQLKQLIMQQTEEIRRLNQGSNNHTSGKF